MPCPYSGKLAELPYFEQVYCFVAIVGAIVVLRWVFSVLGFVWLYFLRPRTNLARYGANLERSGSKRGGANNRGWALVTGCTNGIGRGFAEALAKRGFNIVLLSRNLDKLRKLAQQLEQDSKILTKIITAEASKPTKDLLNSIVTQLQGLELRVLVNNVGVNLDIPAELVDNTDEDIERIINVNNMFSTKLTRCCLPLLRRRPGHGRSLIIDISSFMGSHPSGLLGVYCASKAYNAALSKSVRCEVGSWNIDVEAITPQYVVSNMSKIKRPSFFIPTPQRFANDSLNQIMANGFVSNPYWVHRLVLAFTDSLPESLVLSMMTSEIRKIRQRQLKKKSK